MRSERGTYPDRLSSFDLPPVVFLNFSTSRSTFDLFARRVIRDLEGTSELTDEILKPYSDPDSEKYKEMVRVMCQHLQLDSLQFQRLDDLVKAIGLPKRTALYTLLG